MEPKPIVELHTISVSCYFAIYFQQHSSYVCSVIYCCNQKIPFPKHADFEFQNNTTTIIIIINPVLIRFYPHKQG